MNASSPDPACDVDRRVETFPSVLRADATVLLAGSVDPARADLNLRLLARYGHKDDVGFVITTTASADETVSLYRSLDQENGKENDQSALRVVDTTSKQQYINALYNEVPTVFTPAPRDLERTIMGLSELSEMMTNSRGARHIVIRSLTPLLSETSPAEVCNFLDRVSGLRTTGGIGLFGIDYTAHDEQTIAALAKRVDAVVWVNQTADGSFEFDLDSALSQTSRYEKFPQPSKSR